ncbi:hypothetical protein ACILDT_09870 [Capnocytophaga canis]|uniref:Uncharacterized protein n=1 Tax=Capnocytophaga canis TaxID=1848903 RepID=A0A0B7IL51_9FLAO|nr:hypothetical protein [Capnocytophaga canis]CEN51299.1 conserved hypothetical protein [Capnocytophaga canis]
MTSSIITNKINVAIASGSNVFSEYISLDKGTCVGVYFVPLKANEPEHLVEISVRDPQSNSLIEPVDFRDFKHKGGGYLDGMKQVGFPTNNNKFLVSINASENLADDFKGQLIFVIQRDCGCNME